MIKVNAYGCSHCGMTSRYKASVIRHESDYCKRNPKRKTCVNCVNWVDEGVDSNGKDEPYNQTWRDCGCSKEIKLDGINENENNNCIAFKEYE